MTTTTRSLRVWGGGYRAGLLERAPDADYTFAYGQDASPLAQVSLTMPVRLQSWQSRELHPVFQMNLPEGDLLETIRHAIAKVIGQDDFAVLSVTGGNQVGRNRFTTPEAGLPDLPDATEELESLLTYPDTRELFHELLNRFALRSGISGVQPKVLLAAHERGTLAARQFIVKSWGTDYPQLAANEFFCMTAVKRAGLPVPDFFLSENGGLFIMRRFDLDAENAPLGFEDFCCLQALGAAQKYQGSYERVARSLQDFITPEHLQAAREQFFAMLVFSVLLRNGDAHLKNFGVRYSAPDAPITLAPAYDQVTTTAYRQHDVPALTLAGSKTWWSRPMLAHFAFTRLALPAGMVHTIIERAMDSLADTRHLLTAYQADRPEFRPIGEKMLAAWEQGMVGLQG